MKNFLYLLIFCSTYTFACWENPIISDKPAIFILAMGANTGDEEDNKLKKANYDAQSFANTIAKLLKVDDRNVCIRPNVKQREFRDDLKKLQTLARPQDRVFIYFSGHGTKLLDDNNDEGCYDEVFVIHADFGTDIHKVRDDFFIEQVNMIPTDNIITTIDTCFAGGVLRGTKSCLNVKSKNLPFYDKNESLYVKDCPARGIKNLKGKVYMASEEDKFALEFSDGGLFTTFFVKNIQKYKNFDTAFYITAEQVKTAAESCGQLQYPQRSN